MAQSQKVSATDLSHSLKGIKFPCSKGDLVVHAQENRSPDKVIELLNRMAEKQYSTMADVESEFHRVKSER